MKAAKVREKIQEKAAKLKLSLQMAFIFIQSHFLIFTFSHFQCQSLPFVLFRGFRG